MDEDLAASEDAFINDFLRDVCQQPDNSEPGDKGEGFSAGVSCYQLPVLLRSLNSIRLGLGQVFQNISVLVLYTTIF